MSEITLKNVSKKYENGNFAVREFNLDIHDKEFIIFVGPSGCGKSTTLRMIAGLEEITDGELWIDGQLCNYLEPQERGMSMVFQNYALYPNMTVYGNIAFALKIRKVPKAEIDRQVHEVAKILEIEHLLDRRPNALSGGQKQRVAIGSAIIRQPKAFLMDEPLSNLDAKLRTQMRVELAKLHKKLNTTIIYVTHDQTEAMTMASRIVVMKDGYIQQIGAPKEIYEHPANMFVAGFLGSPAMNFIEGTYKEGMFCFDAHSIEVNNLAKESLKTYENKRIIMGIRPENIYMEEIVAQTYPKSVIDYQLDVKELLGNEYILHGTIGNTPMVAKVNARMELQPHQMLKLTIDANRMNFFDPETEEAIHS